jgi:hypothetical protein
VARGAPWHSNTAAIHAALLEFIDQRLIGSPFVDRASLELALSEWPDFALMKHAITRLDIWEDLMYLDGEIRTRRIGPGGPFVCAVVEEVKDDEDFSDLPPKARALFLRARELGVNSDDIEAVLARIKKAEQPNPDQQTELKTDWKEVVELNPQGYLELNDGKRVVHGPIKSIEIDKVDYVLIELEWAATIALGDLGIQQGDWEVIKPLEPVIFENFTVPFLIEDTPEKGPRVRFAGLNILYINKVEGIDPSKVKGMVGGRGGRRCCRGGFMVFPYTFFVGSGPYFYRFGFCRFTF